VEKRVKSGLAVSEQNLKRMDENLRRTKACLGFIGSLFYPGGGSEAAIWR
jgi:hypothetical protein